MNDITLIPTDLIDPHPHNPRRDIGDLTELVDSILAQGIRQNLLVVPAGSDAVTIEAGRATRFRAVIGHRRLAAAKLAGLAEVPAVVDPHLGEAEQLELMLVENLQRQDLSPIEEAKGYQDLLDLGIKVREIVKTTGRAEKTITGRLRLLALPDAARERVHEGQASLKDAAEMQWVVENADPKKDKKLLKELGEALGTHNFAWKAQTARSTIEGRRACAAARDEERAKAAAHDAAIAEEGRQAYELRDAFVRQYFTRKKIPAIHQLAIVDTVAPLATAGFDLYVPPDWLGLPEPTRYRSPANRVVEQQQAHPDTPSAAWLLAGLHCARSSYGWAFAWKDHRLVALYGLLEQLGYQISDAERARITKPDDVDCPTCSHPLDDHDEDDGTCYFGQGDCACSPS